MTMQCVATHQRFATVRTEGVLARMVRLWIEHHQRLLDLGIRPH